MYNTNKRKYIFPKEIMTGMLNTYNYLTIMTLGVLLDLGFKVDYSDTTNEFIFKDYTDSSFTIIDPQL